MACMSDPIRWRTGQDPLAPEVAPCPLNPPRQGWFSRGGLSCDGTGPLSEADLLLSATQSEFCCEQALRQLEIPSKNSRRRACFCLRLKCYQKNGNEMLALPRFSVYPMPVESAIPKSLDERCLVEQLRTFSPKL